GSLLRVGCMAVTCISLFLWSSLNGASIGGLSLSVGVCVEALVVRAMVAKPLERLLTNEENDASMTTMGQIAKFYYPLAMQSLLALALQPLVTFFVTRCLMPIQSLAVLPVINAYVFVFRCVGLSYNEVIIALLSRGEEYQKALRTFAWKVGAISTVLFAVI